MDKVFWKKVGLAFIVPFLTTLLLGVLNIIDAFSRHEPGQATFSFWLSLTIAAILGAVTAGIRAVLALFTTIIPGDEIHGPNAADTVTVAKSGTVAETGGSK